jgi:hypothetical protein
MNDDLEAEARRTAHCVGENRCIMGRVLNPILEDIVIPVETYFKIIVDCPGEFRYDEFIIIAEVQPKVTILGDGCYTGSKKCKHFPGKSCQALHESLAERRDNKGLDHDDDEAHRQVGVPSGKTEAVYIDLGGLVAKTGHEVIYKPEVAQSTRAVVHDTSYPNAVFRQSVNSSWGMNSWGMPGKVKPSVNRVNQFQTKRFNTGDRVRITVSGFGLRIGDTGSITWHEPNYENKWTVKLDRRGDRLSFLPTELEPM